MSKEIRLDIGYLDFVFQNEFRGIFKNSAGVVNLLDVYISCKKMCRWVENFLSIGVEYNDLRIKIERTFDDNGDSTLRYIERDKTKKIVIDIDNISKDNLLDKARSFFKKIDELK